jgi:hypothetical protein
MAGIQSTPGVAIPPRGIRVTKPKSGGGGGGASYEDTVLVDHPVAYYRLNADPPVDKTGITVVYGVFSGVEFGKPSILPNGNGASGRFPYQAYVHINDSLPAPLGPTWTIEGWIKMTAVPNYHGMVTDYYHGLGAVVQSPGDGVDPFTFMVDWGGTDTRHLKTSFPKLELNIPYHFVTSAEGSTGRLKAYINGALVYDQQPGGPGVATSRQFKIGAQGAGCPEFMQEIAVYDYVLSPARVLAHFNAGMGT